MTIPILSTKLHLPPPQPALVYRARLIDQLQTGLHRKLTLISAPAGFGKTTLLSEWIARCERSAAWISLDEEDSDPVRFMTYFVSALQTVDDSLGQDTLDALHNSQQPPLVSLLTSLINDIAAASQSFLLVLDDYHHIDSRAIDDALDFLLNHLPPQMHLILTTREDPQFPLSRLRVRGQLTELRVADLRFTAEEAADFLNQVMHLNLSPADIAALEKRTEGWIAGLQLAALSMQGRDDTADFIHAFTGSHRFVLDYLVEEVLAQQPEAIRHFLLQTSILQRLNGSLCDAVTQEQNSQKMLENLERTNLFVVALDHHREWYRYHHLFADALQVHLQSTLPDAVSALHLRACDWYEQNNLPQDTIHHALQSEDMQRAADLIERIWPAMDVNYQTATWLTWVKALPEAIVLNRPLLCEGYGWAMLHQGELEASESWFQAAEHWLKEPDESAQNIQFVDEERFRLLASSINSARAYRSLALDDIHATLHFARQALELAGDADHASRTQAIALSGIAYWAKGDLTTADQTLSRFITEMRTVGRIVDAIEITFIVAEIRITCGQLSEAFQAYESAFQLLADMGNPVLMGIEDLYRGVAELYREWGKLDTAEDHLMAAEELSEQVIRRPDWQHRLCVSWARLKCSQGDIEATLSLLDEAQQHYMRTPLPVLRPAAALKARVWIIQGKLVEAQEWALQQGLMVDSEVSYLSEFEIITLARLLLAQYRTDHTAETLQDTHQVLDRLLQSAETGGRMGSAIEILMLKALTYAAQGNTSLALEPLKKALTLAEPEGYLRMFVDEGEPMRNLLADALRQGVAPTYVRRLQAAFDNSQMPASANQGLLEPLSDRELDVLRLLLTELSGPEIARNLMVSLNTVRTHTRNIYGKLGVNNRRAAVRRAEELRLA